MKDLTLPDVVIPSQGRRFDLCGAVKV